MRTETDIISIVTRRGEHEVSHNQAFYETPKMFELWTLEPAKRITGWRKRSVVATSHKQDLKQVSA